MANLNFYQPVKDKEAVKKESSTFSPSLLVGFAFIIIPLAVWGGLWYYNSQLDTRIGQIKADITAAESSLDRKVLSRVATFSSKIGEIGDLVSKKEDPIAMVFDALQMNILKSGVVATEASYDQVKREVLFTFQADNFELVAKQLMKFKSLSDYFSSADFISSDREQSGKISCIFKLVVK